MFHPLSTALALSLMCAPPLEGSIIWNDGFESGNFNSWNSATGTWSIVTSPLAAHSGTKGADVKGANAIGGDLLQASISTFGQKNIELNYWYKVRDTLESADFAFVEWTADGANWLPLATYSNLAIGDWQNAIFSLPAEADNNPNFGFRVRANLSSATDRIAFDDFIVSNAAVPEPSTVATLIGFACLSFLRRRR